MKKWNSFAVHSPTDIVHQVSHPVAGHGMPISSCITWIGKCETKTIIQNWPPAPTPTLAPSSSWPPASRRTMSMAIHSTSTPAMAMCFPSRTMAVWPRMCKTMNMNRPQASTAWSLIPPRPFSTRPTCRPTRSGRIARTRPDN